MFLRNTANKYRVINVISTGKKKAGCNAFHSHDNADIDIINLVVKSFLKYLVTVISENQGFTCIINVS